MTIFRQSLSFFILLTTVAASKARAADETLKPPSLMGGGAQTYQWVHNWLQLPPGMVVGKTHGDVVVDSKDRIYFSTDTGNGIFVVSPAGKVLKVIAQGLTSGGGHGLRLVREGNREVIWIAHPNRHEVLKIDLDGNVLTTLATPALYKDKKDYLPTALDVANNGDVYVVDGYGKNWLHRFDASGALLQSWNGSEGKAGAFNQPHGVGIDARGPEPRVVVADRQNHRLQIFTMDGKFIEAVTENLRLPSKIVVRGDDMLVVDLQGRVTILDKAYKVVAQLGDNSDPALRGQFEVAPDKWKDGEFISPHGAAWDSKGNLYVQDWNAWGRVSKLKRDKGRATPVK